MGYPRRVARDDQERFIKRVLAERDKLQLRFPDIDPEDLLLIVESVLRPRKSGRRYFVRPLPGGGHVP